MAANPSAGTCFVRPIRPDRLQRSGPRLRSRLASAGVAPSDAGDVAKGILAAARLTRTYLDGIRALLRSRTPERMSRVLGSLRRVTVRLQDRLESLGPVLGRALEAAGDGQDASGLAEVWFRGGGPRELASEGRLRRALLEHLSSLGQVRVSDTAHLACLWSDAQRFHAALRGVLDGPAGRHTEVAAFLELVSGSLNGHVLPVDLVGLPGDPGLLEGIPAMASRLGRAGRRGRARG